MEMTYRSFLALALADGHRQDPPLDLLAQAQDIDDHLVDWAGVDSIMGMAAPPPPRAQELADDDDDDVSLPLAEQHRILKRKHGQLKKKYDQLKKKFRRARAQAEAVVATITSGLGEENQDGNGLDGVGDDEDGDDEASEGEEDEASAGEEDEAAEGDDVVDDVVDADAFGGDHVAQEEDRRQGVASTIGAIRAPPPVHIGYISSGEDA